MAPPPRADIRRPAPRAVLELLKPITWFPPIWAFMCGVVSSGQPASGHWIAVIVGAMLAGPLVCGNSQAINDWFDRHVDAINEPNRPIPSGRIPGRWGLGIACAGTVLSFAVGAALGTWVMVATVIGLASAWAYSAPPFRLKASGWWGPALVGLTYEGLSWFTGAAVMTSALPSTPVLIVLVLYSLGAHGIMTLNDFKAVEGDIQTGVRSLPVVLGVRKAALLACGVMALAQVIVAVFLLREGLTLSALIVAGVLAAQFALMPRLLSDPARHTPWYSATGVSLYVLGMLAAAGGLGGHW
ncbi:chlorophyll synthase ChlG [Novosphingobium sp. PASSN1]|uniref:chlorophyll synthase ChlG n=1 Tax=Novosphingobium sp. PASSN1 TaxID=2015561 RepID=UPI0025D3EE9E|nr:chlorophyll synthase ChlG [Novosphingobium sp. PASSN1]